MKPHRAALFACLISMITTYISCGPLPCVRYSARCGLLAYDYGHTVTLFPAQVVVTVLIFGFIVGVLTWFVAARGKPPKVVRLLTGVVLFMAALAAIAGFGGLIGLGAPFILPFLWMAARRTRGWIKGLWIGMAGFAAGVGSWIIGIPLGLQADYSLAIAAAATTVAGFIVSTRSPQSVV